MESLEVGRQTQTSTIIRLAEIEVSETNRIFRRAHEVTKEALQELASSIAQYGVMQPILVRPHSQVEGKYVLIFGERRYRASMLAGKTDIPAYIKNANDDVALEIQVIENLQRENVHPLNEAKGYKFILERNENMTTADLAARFGKSETYILQRLKLNDLVKEAKDDFLNDTMLLGHALILARLTPQDQRSTFERIASRSGYGTVNGLQEFVERNVIHSLSSAPFDKNDVDLYKKAGACINCPKRSGASPLLFAEIKEKDKCFDKNCFFIKCQRFLVNRTKEIIETKPDIVFVEDGGYAPAEEIAKMLADHKIKVLKEYNDFNEYNNGGTKVKGLWISGDKAGHVGTVYLTKRAKEVPGNAPGNEKVLIGKIQHRMERAKELDREKVYAKILESLHKHPTQKKDHSKKMMADEEVMLWYIIFDKAGYKLQNELTRFIGLTKSSPEKFYNLLKKMKPEHKAYMLRRVMLDQYGGNHPESDYGFIIHKIAAGYGDIDISAFEKEQKEICEKREARAKVRIKELQKAKAKVVQ